MAEHTQSCDNSSPCRPLRAPADTAKTMTVPQNRETAITSRYPLALAQTPHFLASFTYQHNGQLFAFDEKQLTGPDTSSRDRRIERLASRLPRAQQISFPAYPKRRLSELTLSAPASKRHLSVEGPMEALSTPEAAPNHLTAFEDPGIGTPMEIASRPDASIVENSLLSPNASPKLEAADFGNPLDPLWATDPQVGDQVPNIIDKFEQLPSGMSRYILFSMMRSCDRSSLSSIASILQDALRCDIVAKLPCELSSLVLSYLDVESLCAASQVCRYWYWLIEQDDKLWKGLIDRDQLSYSDLDIRRAKLEGWAYSGWTRDYSAPPAKLDPARPVRQLEREDQTQETEVALASPFLGAGASSSNLEEASTLNSLGRPVNVFKAIYRRKLLISRNWMSKRSNPRHFSIPCSERDVITCLEFDEDRIIAGSDSKTINVYDTRTGELLHSFDDHEQGVWALKYVNKDTVISGSVDRTVRVWSLSKGRCTHVFRGHSSTVRCLDVVMPRQKLNPDTGDMVLVPPYPVIVTGSRDSTLRMWRLPGPDDVEYFAPESNVEDVGNPFFIRALTGHHNAVRAINGYEDTVVSGSYDFSIRVWRISDGVCRHELVGHQQKVYSAVIDPKRNRCISASMDWSVKVWCIDTGTLLYTLEGHTALVGLLDLSKTMLVSAAADSTLRVWDPETGMLRHKLEGHQNAITCFQHDETKVVSGSEKTLKLWNIKTGELVSDLFDGFDVATIWQVGFDSRRCVSAVLRNSASFLEVLDFDYDPSEEIAPTSFGEGLRDITATPQSPIPVPDVPDEELEDMQALEQQETAPARRPLPPARRPLLNLNYPHPNGHIVEPQRAQTPGARPESPLQPALQAAPETAPPRSPFQYATDFFRGVSRR